MKAAAAAPKAMTKAMQAKGKGHEEEAKDPWDEGLEWSMQAKGKGHAEEVEDPTK